MAWAIVPTPGTDLCANECEHTDCAANRELLAAVCGLCSGPLLPGDRYTGSDRDECGYVHFACAVVEADRREAARLDKLGA